MEVEVVQEVAEFPIEVSSRYAVEVHIKRDGGSVVSFPVKSQLVLAGERNTV